MQLPRPQLFELQDSVTTEVAEFLRRRLGEAVSLRESRAGTRSVAAWELVQRAAALQENAGAFDRANAPAAAIAAYLQADTLLFRAERIDARWDVPTLTRGWLARNVALLASDPRDKAAWLVRGIAHAERVLARYPGRPRALVLRGALRVDSWLQGLTPDSTGMASAAERDLRAAVSAEPELARGWYALSVLLPYLGRAVEADEAARQALEFDAYLTEAREVMASLFFNLLYRERFDEARHWCNEGRRRFPTNPNFRSCELRVLGWSARDRGAIGQAWRLLDTIEAAEVSDQSPLDPVDRRLMIAAVIARAGLSDSAENVLTRLHAETPQPVLEQAAFEEAGVRVLLGEHEEAMRLLRIFLAGNPQMRETMAKNPWFRALTAYPAFDSLVAAPR